MSEFNTGTEIMITEEHRLLAERTKRFILSLDPSQAEDYKEHLINNYSIVDILSLLKRLN